MERQESRAVPRFFLTPPLNGFASGRAVRVIDVSSKGARLETVEPLESGSDISLAILTGWGEVTVKAGVLWCDLDSLQIGSSHDRYLAGLVFRSPSHGVEDLIDEVSTKGAAIRIEDFRNFERYRLGAPMTASFGEYSPISLINLSLRGARIESGAPIPNDTIDHLIFQIDEKSGPTDVEGRVVWTNPIPTGGFQAGLLIDGVDDIMRAAIHRLCARNEAQIDLDALRRKFDMLRAEWRAREKQGAA